MDFVMRNPTRATILAYDPGTVRMGQAVMEFDLINFEIIQIHHSLINVEKLPTLDHEVRVHGDLHARILAAARHVESVLRWSKPICLAYENNFMNIKAPSAYGPLVALEMAVKIHASYYDPQLPVNLWVPSQVKKAIGTRRSITGKMGKEEVLLAFSKCAEITHHLDCPIKEINHNTIDAICIAYAQLCAFRNTPRPPQPS